MLDADIRDFFGQLDRDWLMKFLRHRIADERVLRLIGKWLAAGVIEDGTWAETGRGSPQGSLCNAFHNPPWGVPVSVCSRSPSSVRTPDFRNAFTSAQTRLSLILARKRPINAVCEISSKQALMSASSTQV